MSFFSRTEVDGTRVIHFENGKVNALDLELCRAFAELFQELESESLSPVVLTGAGRIFSAGVDLVRVINESEDYLDEFLPALTACFTEFFRVPFPLIAVINGHAIAGGCIIAAACDYRVAHGRVRIGLPELRVGVALPAIAIEIMRFVAAPNALSEMLTIGRNYREEEAVRVGLVDCIGGKSELLDLGIEYAQQFEQIPSDVFSVTKQQLRLPALQRAEMLEDTYGDRVRKMWKAPATREMIAEYVEKRL